MGVEKNQIDLRPEEDKKKTCSVYEIRLDLFGFGGEVRHVSEAEAEAEAKAKAEDVGKL